MKISVFGLGYVGAVSAACFAKLGHEVIGVDVVQYKIDSINHGKAPLEEKDLQNLIQLSTRQGRLSATTSVERAILDSNVSFICVGTPPKKDGSIDLSFLKKVCQEIAQVLKKKDGHLIVVRSTMLPGSLETLKDILEKSSNKKEGVDFFLATNPEFLREGSAIKDFFNPPYVVVGAYEPSVGKKVLNLYSGVKTKKFVVKPELAQMIKYASNSWHAVKVSFANEIGVICKAQGIDSKKLMDLFCEDNQLNISSYYMKPGFAYGGSCLPKDLAAIQKRAKKLNLNTPLLNSTSPSNLEHITRAIKIIQQTKKKRIGILGITFKQDTDDIRGNPILLVINKLLNNGHDIKIYDPLITKNNLKNISKSYRKEVFDLVTRENLKDNIADISSSFDKLENVLNQEVVIISNRNKELQKLLQNLDKNQIVIDLQNIIDYSSTQAKYLSIT